MGRRQRPSSCSARPRERARAAPRRRASSCAFPARTRSSRCRTISRATASSSCFMNTRRVGGPEEDERSKKVRIKHSSAIVKGIAEGTIEWVEDPDFGYMVAASVPGIDSEDIDILQPQRLYDATGRKQECDEGIARLKDARAEFLAKFPSLSAEIVDSVH